jgi:hypothetical protein
MKFASIVTVLALSVVGVAHAQSALAPPQGIRLPKRAVESRQMEKQPVVSGVTIGDFKVTFEKTTLKQALAALGAAPVGRRGDAGNSLSWICYTIPAVRTRIWLLSDEMGGGETIMRMTARPALPTEVEDMKCPTPTNHASAAFIDNKIWLGDSIGKIESILGKSSEAPKSIRYYWYNSPEDENGFSVQSLLLMKIEGDRVTEIQASNLTTN